MKILDIGQGLYINPEYIIKLEKAKIAVGENIIFTIDIYLAYLSQSKGINYSFGSNSIERLSFDTIEKRDDFFLYLFKLINNESSS